MSAELMSRSEEFTAAVLRAAEGFVEAIPGELRRGLARLNELARDPEFLDTLQSGINAALRAVREEIENYERDPRSFLYDEMVSGPAVVLIAAVRLKGEAVLIDGLEWAWGEGDLASRASASLPESPYLTPSHRTQLSAGLEYLNDKDWTLACTLLMTGVEGALWATAEAVGSVDAGRRLVISPQQGRILRSPNSVATEALSDLSPSFSRYLDRQLFDGRGHDLRHGRGNQDERAHALFAASAILGWLDHYNDTGLMSELGELLSSYATDQVGPAISRTADGG